MNTPVVHDRKSMGRDDTQAWKPILVFALFTLVIGMTGMTVFQRYEEDIKSRQLHELGSIADAKIKDVERWIQERQGDAQSIAEGPFFLEEAEQWLARGGPPDRARSKLLERMALLQQAYSAQGYTEITLFDSNAAPRLSTDGDLHAVHGIDQQNLLESMRRKQIVFSDIHLTGQGDTEDVEVELMAPLVVGSGDERHVIGAILLRIDPRRFLFPFIQQWPISGTSVENMIVRREGDEVVYLNQLRYLDRPPLSLRLPVTRQQLLAVKAFSGERGVVEGVDYRGVPSLAVLSRITGTSWRLITKIDRDEVFAPIRHLGRWVFGLSLLAFATGCAIFVYWWKKQRQHIRLLQEQREAEQKYRQLFDLAQEGICVADADSVITMVNPALAAMLGYAPEAMVGRHLSSFMDEQGKRIYAKYLERRKQGAHDQYDFEFVRKDGARIHAAVAAAPIMDNRGVYRGAVAGVMDITERKQSEAKLVAAYRELQQLSSHMDSVREEERTRIARELHDEMGATLAALKMRVAWLASQLPAGSVTLAEEVRQMSGLVSDGIRTMRHVVSQLRPSTVKDMGFAAAVEDSVKNFCSHTGAECRLDLAVDEESLSSDQAAALFRIIQEALNNVAKHAQARHVDVSLSWQDDALLLVIEDDGIGFGGETSEKSFGLIGIRERASMMGGSASIASAEGKGTRVTVIIPAVAPETGDASAG